MLKHRGKAALALAGVLLATSAAPAQAQPCPPLADRPTTALSAMIADPEAHHGKAVTVIAYITLEFENMTACPSKDDTTIGRCLWLNIDDGSFKSDADYARYQTKLRDWQRFNRQTVILRASFDKNEKGHVSMWPGGLGKVCGVSLP